MTVEVAECGGELGTDVLMTPRFVERVRIDIERDAGVHVTQGSYMRDACYRIVIEVFQP